jgi:hypothetical protein
MTSNVIAENQTLSDLELIRNKFKKTIILSILFFVSGVVVVIAGIGVNRKPALYIGPALALMGLFTENIQSAVDAMICACQTPASPGRLAFLM